MDKVKPVVCTGYCRSNLPA